MIQKQAIDTSNYEIWTQELTKYYARGENQVKAVDSIDISMASGIHGFLGPNGAGKTSTINMLIGAISITKGIAFVKGLKAGSRKCRKIIGFLPQDPGLYSKLTGKQYLKFVAQMNGVKKLEAERRTDEFLEKFDLKDAENRKIETYSGGMKQKVAFASALIGNAEIFVLDEPTSDLDPIMRNNIIKDIKNLARNKSIFVSSHVLSEVELMCDRVTIINRGKIITTDTIKNIKKMHTTAKNIYLLDTNSNEKILEDLNGKDFIDKAWIDEDHNIINIMPKDTEALQKYIPEAIIKNNLLLRKFYQKESTLQEIFLEMMNEEGEEKNVN